ncbi:MAG: 16S rRNA (guanine(527)-N(7))-methyltransferase RsmG, partial [Leptolyngbyaceae bacterium]|nr:16S rRNA (guanine(527)-N(7))-methyltransferase RsmG [Leptolyngbyaceae bacterium]
MTGSTPYLDPLAQSPMVQAIAPTLPLHLDIWQDTLGWCPSDRQQQQFQSLYEQIYVGNQSLNLTRITQPDEFWEKHLWDALSGIHFLLGQLSPEALLDEGLPTNPTENPAASPAENCDLTAENSDLTAENRNDPHMDEHYDGDTPEPVTVPQIEKVLDIGTGAGFPGLPVAIACPHWQLTLLDSTRKKIAFIDSILAQLELTNVHTFTHRAEALGRNSHHRYQYDLVLVRAVAATPVCAEYALPFLKVGGLGILYRGRWTEAEEDSL